MLNNKINFDIHLFKKSETFLILSYFLFFLLDIFIHLNCLSSPINHIDFIIRKF